MLYEIRNYHIRPESLAAYTNWAKNHAIPHLSKVLNVGGFWVNSGEPSQITGEPMDKLGSANVTWILIWKDMAERDAKLPETFGSETWQGVFAHLPDGLDNYTRMESKFAKSLT
jgi:hypothetical protein